ncbi:MAG: hypothetical protein K0U86_09535 [Planctomycetes bacterium]|nr:hypothetical protein [Planctomycetota bacterium]MCH9725132.1 hypothetical protein [Planctomycetota bacterium]MCH9774906.1 hypothetical protein [Planctomycetota bacterium]
MLKDASGNGHDGKIVGAKWVKVDDELKVIEDSIFSQPLSDAEAAKHRKTAEWVIQQGGSVNIALEGDPMIDDIISNVRKEGWAKYEVSKLPSQNFRLYRISIDNREDFDDQRLKEMVQLCEGLNTITNLKFEATAITDAGLEDLIEISQNLRNIGLFGENFSDRGLLAIAKLEQIEGLHIGRKDKFTSAGLDKLQNSCPKLEIIWAKNK